MKNLAIRLSDDDHAVFQKLADLEHMPVSVLVRRSILQIAEQRGLITDPAKAAANAAANTNTNTNTNSKPPVQRGPIPTAPNAWRDHIYARVQAGEKLQDVADSYGIKLADAQGMYNRAKAYIKEQPDYVPHAYTPAPAQIDTTPDEYTPPTEEYTPPTEEYTPPPDEPELVYAPVDPENPTEEEQAIHAEIARRRLVAMGFYV